MAINPSCNNVTRGRSFPVLGDSPFEKDRLEIAKKEIQVVFPEALFNISSETKKVYKKGSLPYKQAMCGISGFCEVKPENIEEIEFYEFDTEIFGWKFCRAWYYWTCHTKDNAIPKKIAEKFNELNGQEVRVNGFSGGTNVDDDVSNYHIDTVNGLSAFVSLLKEINTGN